MARRSVKAIDTRDDRLGRLTAALDASHVVGTWDWDLVRRTIVYDEGAARLLTGDATLADRELDGLASIAAVNPADHASLVDGALRSVREGGPILTEYRVRTPEGGTRWLLSRGRTYHDRDGRPIRARGIVIDVTENRTPPTQAPGKPDPLIAAADLALAMKQVLEDSHHRELDADVDLLLRKLGFAIARTFGQH